MPISEKDKQAIDKAVADRYYVSTDAQGNKSIDAYYADYNDTNNFLLQTAYDKRKAAFEEPDVYEPENELLYTLQDEISGVYDEQRWDIEDEIIRAAGFDPSDDKAEKQIEYLRETYAFEVPFDHFLKQTMDINIMLKGKDEADADFSLIHDQYEALRDDFSPEDAKETLEQESGLTVLLQQQGYSMEDLQQTWKHYDAVYNADGPDHRLLDAEGNPLSVADRSELFRQTESKFLASVCSELENMTNYMNCVTVLARVTMYEFAEMMKPGKEVTIPKDAMVGIFSPWQGGGSSLDIELEKDLVIPSEKIWDVQIEGSQLRLDHNSLNSTYGLVGSAWTPIKSIKDAAPAKKPSLNSLIQSAESKTQSSPDNRGPAKEAGRG